MLRQGSCTDATAGLMGQNGRPGMLLLRMQVCDDRLRLSFWQLQQLQQHLIGRLHVYDGYTQAQAWHTEQMTNKVHLYMMCQVC